LILGSATLIAHPGISLARLLWPKGLVEDSSAEKPLAPSNYLFQTGISVKALANPSVEEMGQGLYPAPQGPVYTTPGTIELRAWIAQRFCSGRLKLDSAPTAPGTGLLATKH